MTVYGFDERLLFSKGVVAATCEKTILGLIAGARQVVPVKDVALDKKGVDYIATLRGGAEIYIDHKAREGGAAKNWNCDAEFALENWSVIPNRLLAASERSSDNERGKVGWTLDESKISDCILFTFDPAEWPIVYLLPFQHLRVAFRDNGTLWIRKYKTDRQKSQRHGRRWRSACVFVPVNVVLDAVRDVMTGNRLC